MNKNLWAKWMFGKKQEFQRERKEWWWTRPIMWYTCMKSFFEAPQDRTYGKSAKTKQKKNPDSCNCTITLVPSANPKEERTLGVLSTKRLQTFESPFLFRVPLRSLRQTPSALSISMCTGSKVPSMYIQVEVCIYNYFNYVQTDCFKPQRKVLALLTNVEKVHIK